MPSIYNLIVDSVESLSRKAGLNSLITHTFYDLAIDENAIVVDLGANVGSFAREMTNLYQCRCYAVEALPQYCDEIVENEFVKKFNIAISDKNGPISIHVSANREANSIDKSIAEDWGYDGTAATCDGMTLETFLDKNDITHVDLLKIDIEGAERHLFESTSDGTLARIKQITIEFHDFIQGSITTQQVNAISRRLRNLGFYCIPMSYLYPSMLNADVLFINTAAINIKSSDKFRFALINALLHAEKFKSSLTRTANRQGNAE